MRLQGDSARSRGLICHQYPEHRWWHIEASAVRLFNSSPLNVWLERMPLSTVAWGQIRLSTSKRADQEMGWEARQTGDTQTYAHRHTLVLDLMQAQFDCRNNSCGWMEAWQYHESVKHWHKRYETNWKLQSSEEPGHFVVTAFLLWLIL